MTDTKMSSSLGGRQVHRKLTIEMFQSLLKADSLDQVGTTIPENGKLDFHEDMYQLQSLIGAGETERVRTHFSEVTNALPAKPGA